MEKLYAQDQAERNVAVSMPAVVEEIERTSSRTVAIVAPTVEPRAARDNKPRVIIIP